MNLAFSEEQDELRRTVRSFLAQKSPESEVRNLMTTEDGYDRAVWRQMADQLGLQGLHIPTKFGGSGFSYAELCIVLEEMGARLLCAPFFSSVVLAANALLQADDDLAKTDFLPGIASGDTIATLAVADAGGRWDEAGVGLAATKIDDGWKLDGSKSFVIDGANADLILVAGRTGGGVSLFAVQGDAPGMKRTHLPTMDLTRKQAKLDFAGVPARIIGAEGTGWSTIERVRDLVAVALANECAGGAQTVLDMAVEYAKVRIQYGRPIGSFQAIKHKCADMLLEVESSKSAAYYAAGTVAEAAEEVPMAASLAKAYVGDAYFHVAAENIQIHGGIGFTWEHPAHLYFKRAVSSKLLFGEPTYERERLAQRIGL